MQLIVDPPFDQWAVVDDSRPSTRGPDENLAALWELMANHACRLGTGRPRHAQSFLATGHQPWLWHPGIFAKDLAVCDLAPRIGAGPFHAVVDQDVRAALGLELPVVRDGRLGVEAVVLGPYDATVPTGCQGPVPAHTIRQTLVEVQRRLGKTLAANVKPIMDAFSDPPDCRTLAQQITVALGRLREPWIQEPLPVIFATELTTLPGFRTLVEQMLGDAPACVENYNRSVATEPAAGVAPLGIRPNRVELPLWALSWGQPRRRVFADLAGRTPVLVLEDSQPIDVPDALAGGGDAPQGGRFTLAPRALLLTAVLRRWCCDRFVHGRGGARYDRVTQRWWGAWLGQQLAPVAVVSADLRMDFAVPVADDGAVAHAAWWSHHVAHNVDRAVPPSAVDRQQVQRKRFLIDHMDDDRDPQRRAAAFAQIHAINDALGRAHRGVLERAGQNLEETKLGRANQRVALKRDWCFALYDRAKLQAMARSLGATPK